MKNVSGHLYPETADEILPVFESRKNRASHPAGTTDKGGRWYPAQGEHASCCDAIRSPSRAHPYSYMVHCRTHKHIETWYNEHVVQPRRARKIGEGIGLGVGFGSYAIYTQTSPSIEQLKARRLECLTFALAMHRRMISANPHANMIDWEHAKRYWIEQAYHAHGEILTQTPPEMRPDFIGWDYDERGHRSPLYHSDSQLQ